jgi:hypothetical protein
MSDDDEKKDEEKKEEPTPPTLGVHVTEDVNADETLG